MHADVTPCMKEYMSWTKAAGLKFAYCIDIFIQNEQNLYKRNRLER